MINIQLDSVNKSTKVALPGSKYIANRLVVLAALSDGVSNFFNVPDNDDIKTAIDGLSKFGARFNRSGTTLECQGISTGSISATDEIYTAHSGTFSRFIVAVAALSNEWVAIRGSDKMNSRPMADMFEALRNSGVEINADVGETLPIKIKGPLANHVVAISGGVSSQYISALLLTACRLTDGLELRLTTEPVSKPYIEMTIDLINSFGVEVEISTDFRQFSIAAGQRYQPQNVQIPTDPSSASYFLAYAAITESHICLENYQPEKSLQGEAKFSEVLTAMGCKIWQDEAGYHCQGPERLQGVSVDMGDMPDVVQTLAVVAAFAEGETHIDNIENLAFKESNRIEDTATELRKSGLEVQTTVDSMTIVPKPLQSACFDTYDDHRMAMSLALMAAKVSGISMRDPMVVSKSFPSYWDYLEQLGFKLTTK